MTAFYNEIDPFAARWLRNLIAAGHIAPGIVDERDIRDITPSELRGFTQCHFFAGIGVWSYALRLAGWPDDRPIWTGSCPCQPFSAAGKGSGFDDERHLWPAWQHLIHECGPSAILGEQVASKDGYAWLDLVQADMEGMGYACGAVVSPSAGYGAPHERHRQFFGAYRGVEHATSDGRQQWRTEPGGRGVVSGCGTVRLDDPAGTRHFGTVGRSESFARDEARLCVSGAGRTTSVVGNSHDARLEGLGFGYQTATGQRQGSVRPASETGEFSVMADTDRRECGRFADGKRRLTDGETTRRQQSDRELEPSCSIIDYGPTGPTNGFWRDADWLKCRDDKWRPVEPGSFPLAHGIAARVGLLRGYGNAINAHQAKAFVEAFRDTIDGTTDITGTLAHG